MRRPKRKVSVQHVFQLAERLSPSERGELRHKLNTSWGDRWESLVAIIEENNKGLPPITEEEIYANITEHRREQRAKRAQSSNCPLPS
jgi:hypothetical protein